MSDLSRLIGPKSIAVVGGGAWCTNVIRECQAIGFQGAIWPVHPRHDQIEGRVCVRSVSELPNAPDAAFVGVNREASIDVIGELSKMKAGGAVCFAAGFKEAIAETSDGLQLQAALLAAAGEMPLLGPNCYGFINALDKSCLWPDQHGLIPVGAGVAIVTQSSNIALNLTMQQRGLPIAFLGTVGNQAKVDLSDLCGALLSDTRITAIGVHIEGIADLAKFESFAMAARNSGKPIVALKVGQSRLAQAATVSHTASIAGSAAGARALLHRLGIAQVEDLSTFIETLKLVHFAGPLTSNRLVSLSCSGGEASLVADTALHHDVVFPQLSDIQRHKLHATLGSKVALANPLDYQTYIWGDQYAMQQTFEAALSGDVAIGCIVLDFPRQDRCSAAQWDIVLDAARDACRTTGRPIAIVASLSDNLSEQVAALIVSRGLIPLHGLPEALSAIAHAAWLGQLSPDMTPLVQPGKCVEATALTEAQAKRALYACGVPVPAMATAITPVEAGAAAEKIGFPVALKLENVAHKTEVGGVVLNLESQEAVVSAAEAMGTGSYLVEQMIPNGICELIIGVICDPAHGFVLTIGAGGIFTELLSDSVSLLLPVRAEGITAALDQLKVAALLDGYRGGPKANRAAIVEAVLALQEYVITNADTVAEVEINPLICTGSSAIAADALIRKGAEND